MKCFMDQTLFRKPAFVHFFIFSNKLWILFYRYDYNDVLLNANFRSALPQTDLLNRARCAHSWPRWMQNNIINEESTLVQAMAWHRQRAIRYFSQSWTIYMSLHGVIVLQCGLVTPYSEILSTLADGTNPIPEYLLTHWGRYKMVPIFQTAFWNAFSWMKMHQFR